MLASKLFKMIEFKVPMELALATDPVGFMGPGDPEKFEIRKALVVLDYHQEKTPEYDLVISHHPPLVNPTLPTYVLHSNWDIVPGGANDALADSLKLEVNDFFDDKTGIGRICSTNTSLKDFLKNVSQALKIEQMRIVKGKKEKIKNVAIVSGFGLNPEYIELAYEKGMDLLLSGDRTHKGAITAKKLGISVVDATHQATEIPGLLRLCKLISNLNIVVEFRYPGNPWTIFDNKI